jgi:hypothetical protein
LMRGVIAVRCIFRVPDLWENEKRRKLREAIFSTSGRG